MFRGASKYLLTLVKVPQRSCENVDDNLEEELLLETWYQSLGEGGGNIRVVGSAENNATKIPQFQSNQIQPSRCGNYALVIRGDYPVERTILGCAIIEWLS